MTRGHASVPGAAPRSVWRRRVGWFVGLCAAGVLALAASAGLLGLLLRAAGLTG